MLDAKLQIKTGKTVAVLDAPFEPPLDAVRAEAERADTVVVFVRDQASLDARLGLLQKAAGRGALTWVAYPKARALGTDLNRDTIHAWTEGKGLDTVRQIALDETWSAMRLKAVPPCPNGRDAA